MVACSCGCSDFRTSYDRGVPSFGLCRNSSRLEQAGNSPVSQFPRCGMSRILPQQLGNTTTQLNATQNSALGNVFLASNAGPDAPKNMDDAEATDSRRSLSDGLQRPRHPSYV